MSVRYELVRLVVRIAAALAAAVVLAALWAVAHGGAFRDSLSLGCYVIGALALLLAFMGGSPSRRDAIGWMGQVASRGSFRLNAERPPERTLGPTAVLLLVAVVLTLLGWAIG